ncbi:O-methyltransferase [Sediminivirga luteola]|uniref:O-methyltransferase YrrM n=1 Tax=Sediminivirga luteola TaxID=1774748 RepID=A0A8J2U0Y2_9MICO|nr:class I SAM-dependent methyltransferase [Sediminivirga luteola]MCI2266841.1 class I SAM-dependent methyltransferase [Sediminivirga luteola]GGA26865.1 hypothetical protein GCM10011333_32110 [Sediminivirga luteola]
MADGPFTSAMITDPAVLEVMTELYERERVIDWSSYDHSPDPFDHTATGFSIAPQQGDQLYLLARHGRARTVVEFATSLGFSTLFLAAAVRDNGGGTVYTAELVPEKAAQAQRNLERAGLGEYVRVLVGDARETLADVPEEIDLVLIDGWVPDVSLDVLRLLEPKLRSGAVVFNDNQEPGYLAHVRDAANGYRSMALLSDSGYKPRSEVSVRL